MATDQPRGEFAIDEEAQRSLARRFVAGAAAFALTFIAIGIVRIEPSALWEWALVVFPFLLAVCPIPIIAWSAVGWLRGNPVLVLSDRGIEVRRGGLWTAFPFLKVAEREVIPWDSIRDIRSVGLGIVVDHDEYRATWYRRLFGPSAPGALVHFARLEASDVDPHQLLVDWNERRLVDSVRAGRTLSETNENVP